MKLRFKVSKVSLPVPLPAAASRAHVRVVLDSTHHDPTKQLDVAELVVRIVALAQVLRETQFYPYQVELASRIVESLLLHDSAILTSLMARQSGKTEVVGALVAALLIILPSLAKQFPESWHLNLTDEKGTYRGYANGVKVGIYAPRMDQSGIMFDRVRLTLDSDTSKKVLRESGLTLDVCNGNTVRLSNGSRVLCESASEQSKIEGETHHLLVLEEAQDISDVKVRKSLHPMVSATGGTIVKVGTATTQKCDFYTTIKTNERMRFITNKRDHFFFPYTVVEKYNSLYRKVIEREKVVLGIDSDEFRTSYCGDWVFERGMFVTQEQLFSRSVAQVGGLFSVRYPNGLIKELAARGFSLVCGIDWGSASDSTVVTSLAVDWNNPIMAGEASNASGLFRYSYYQKHTLDWLEFIGDNYEHQFHEVVAYLRQLKGLRKVVTDSNGCGRPIYDRLVATLAETDIEVEDFNFQPRLKSDGFKSLYADICGERLTFPASDNVRKTTQFQKFVNQMLDLQKTYKNQLMNVAHPQEKGAHDDYASSLMLGCWGANSPSAGGLMEFSESNMFYR